MSVSFADSIKNAFVKAFDFKTRSSRAEFWYFYLFSYGTIALLFLLKVKIDFLSISISGLKI